MSPAAVPRVVWQVSGGPGYRPYWQVLLNHSVALIPRGDAGPWTPDRDDVDFGGGTVRRFADEVAIGDIALLRIGVATIGAIGLVASDYAYLSTFDDVNGWDLQHSRRVRWCPLTTPYTVAGQGLSANAPPCSRVLTGDLLEFAARFVNSPPTYWQTAPLPDLPNEEAPLDRVPEELADLVAQVGDLTPLLQDRSAFGDRPSESELIAHFVVPFLRALGWPPERLALEWRRVDLAVFKGLPRVPENCHLVIEAKRLGDGSEAALDQAKGYLRATGVACDVIITDGIRYRMYTGPALEPVAYANLARLKQSASVLFERMRRA